MIKSEIASSGSASLTILAMTQEHDQEREQIKSVLANEVNQSKMLACQAGRLRLWLAMTSLTNIN